MVKMKVRKAKVSDLKRIIQIFREEYSKSPYHERWSQKWARQRITKDFKDCASFVLEINGEIQGFLIVGIHTWDAGPRGFIEEIVIAAPFQRKGYGRELLIFAEKWFKKKGAKAIALITSPKAKAFHIYKKYNYKEEGLISMCKRLS